MCTNLAGDLKSQRAIMREIQNALNQEIKKDSNKFFETEERHKDGLLIMVLYAIVRV